MHTLASTGAAFAILFAVLGFSFVYVSANPVTLTTGEPWIGFFGTPLTPDISEAIGTSEQSGFLLVDVISDSPAAKAGMRGGDRIVEAGGRQVCAGGDIIIEVGGRPVTGQQEIIDEFEGKNIGDTMDFTVVRGSVTFDIPVVLEEAPLQTPEPACNVQ